MPCKVQSATLMFTAAAEAGGFRIPPQLQAQRHSSRPARMPATYHLPHLRTLEAEAVHVMREVAAEFEHPVLLFSGGKDSIVLLRVAEKGFRPGGVSFPRMHGGTGE